MRTTTTLLTSLFAASLLAQSPYRPFPEGNAGWVEDHAWLQPSGGCSEYTWDDCTRPVYFGSDTTIGGTSYHRLLQHGACNAQLIAAPQPMPPWCVYAWSYTEPQSTFAYIRQDVDERRVYIYDVPNQQEQVLYDFNMGIGAYPITYNNLLPGQLHVVALDSMELNDGWHRTWVLATMWMEVMQDSAFCTIIEGVGSTLGLTAMLWPPFENSDALICHSVDGNTIYPFGDSVCDLAMGGGSERPVQLALQVFPNPAEDHVTLTLAQPGSGNVMIHDARGSIVQRSMWPTGSTSMQVDLHALETGIYLVEVVTPEGRSAARVVRMR